MMLLLLASLLVVLPAASPESPIFGPQEVSSTEGDSVSIKCYYPNTSVNRHSRKFWCRQDSRHGCVTLISSGGFVSKHYMGRANLTNFPESNMFVVDIAQLSQNDSGQYKCGLGVNNRGLSFDVSLQVNKDHQLPADVQVYRENVGGEVIIQCPFKAADGPLLKSFCKKIDEKNCMNIIDTVANIHQDYKGRISLRTQGTDQLLFTVSISRLRPGDAGLYRCKAGKTNLRDVALQVLTPEPELVYGDLRGSVSFDCDLGSTMAQVPKFLCRMNAKGGCDVVINSLGNKGLDYEGRILLTPVDQNGMFSVLITGLKKGDAGRYLCGAHPDGVPEQGWPLQSWQLFVNEETSIPHTLSVVKGVAGGSVAVRCSYNPKESNPLKYWCRWESNNNGICPLLVESEGLVNQKYKGRLALFEEPGKGTYTVILNQLTTQDDGFYWCLTNGDVRWRSTVEIKVVDGKPDLKVPASVTVLKGETVKLPCNFSCKYYSHEKYWCKWSSKGCQTLPSQEEGSGQEVVNCDLSKRLLSLTLNSVTEADEGWYWCGVKQGDRFGETAAVYVTVTEKTQKSQDVSQAKAPAGSQDASKANAAPSDEVVEPNARKFENKAILDPKLVSKDFEAPVGEREVAAQPDASSSGRQGGSSTVLVSTLVPLALVLVVGAVVVGVLRGRHRKNVDRISIRSYRTDISMSELENPRDLGANDNKGVSSIDQETSLGKRDDPIAAAESTTESHLPSQDPKKAKRSSKEEADLAYTAFLLQANHIAAGIQDGPPEA